METTQKEALAWAAGFFDGEGCTSSGVREGKWRSLTVIIGQYHPDVLHRFRDAVGIGKVYGPYPHNGSQSWSYQVTGLEKCQAVIAMLWPWLSIEKRQQYATMVGKFLTPVPFYDWSDLLDGRA